TAAEQPERLVEHRAERHEIGRLARLSETALQEADAHARLWIVQASEILDRARGWLELEVDALARENRLVLLREPIVSTRRRTRGHDEHFDGHVDDSRSGDRASDE